MKLIITIAWNILLWNVLFFSSLYHNTTIYLFHQSCGQISVLLNTQSFDDYLKENDIGTEERHNLELIEAVKKYSVDSLNYKPTKNFTSIYNQKDAATLWVITASSKYKIEPYYWKFPIVGRVSYKGFFDKQKAIAAKNKLIGEGYDVDLRSVSAWSTLGWFSDPILSNMLKKSKGNLCNLIFHELFHATYYAESSVDFNENLASFIAHKATIRYLKNDSAELKTYLESYNDNLLIENHISKELAGLNQFYDSIADYPDSRKHILKLTKLLHIAGSLNKLNLNQKGRIKGVQSNILEFKNAWFVDFGQYNSLQDSLEGVFNKFYQSNLSKMVQSLK